MHSKRSLERLELQFADSGAFPWDVEFHGSKFDEVVLRPPTSYCQALGEEPIRVGIVEFQIMLFLASWPYHAFTQREIAEAISTNERTIAEARIDDYVASLRDQLGVFHDYVQTVPYVGYRFKA